MCIRDRFMCIQDAHTYDTSGVLIFGVLTVDMSDCRRYCVTVNCLISEDRNNSRQGGGVE